MKITFKRTIKTLLSFAVLVPTLAISAQFQASRTGEIKDIGLASDVPLGATIYQADPSEVLKKDTRTRSCAQVYGAAPSGVSYSGGPWSEYRFETGFEKDASGNYISDGAGGHVKTYSAWQLESGECQRNHDYTRNTRACPANQQGQIVDRHRYTVLDDDSVINNTGWVEISRTCAFYLVSTGTENQTRACPAGMVGQYTDRRSFQNWSDGSKRAYTAWVQIGNTCTYYHVNNGYEDMVQGCPAGMTGQYVYRRTFQNWSDGSRRAYSAYSLIANSCTYYHVSNSHEDSNASCPAGYNGHIVNRRTFQIWSDGSRRAYSGWYQVANYCTPAGCSPQVVGGYNINQSGPVGTVTTYKTGCGVNYYTCQASGQWTFTRYVETCGNGN